MQTPRIGAARQGELVSPLRVSRLALLRVSRSMLTQAQESSAGVKKLLRGTPPGSGQGNSAGVAAQNS